MMQKGHDSGSWRNVAWLLISCCTAVRVPAVDAQVKRPAPAAPRIAGNLVGQVQWREAPLRDALMRLGRNLGIPIVLDRRIDPQTSVTGSIQGSPLAPALQAFAEPRGWHVAPLPHVLYVGPRESISALATWHAQQAQAVVRLPTSIRRRWQSDVDASWPELTEPRQLVERWLDEAGVTGEGTAQIPHDLWPAQSLPAINLLERLTIALAGFQLAPAVQPDGTLRIVNLPREATISQSFPWRATGSPPLDVLRVQFPDLEWTQHGTRLEATGRWEDLQRVPSWLEQASSDSERPAPRRQRAGMRSWANKRFTLTVKNQSIEAIIDHVVRQVGLESDWDPRTETARKERISLSVENLTFEVLLNKILANQPLRYQIDGRQLSILPSDG